MSKISKDDVNYIAALAQLTIDDATNKRLQGELSAIVDYMDQLNSVDTSSVEPMMHVLEVSNVFRDDEVQPSLPRETALANAPKTDGEHFLVPRILGLEEE
jgi:aspartyl-tRNA(Asn)/glutamyl-tRNA(Gln) amidotransferase subunit C